MKPEIEIWRKTWRSILGEFSQQAGLLKDQVLVLGCSTSEVIGERIGSAGTKDVAEMIYEELSILANETGIRLAFQCCEHLNRAIVIERETADRLSLDEVTVVPIRTAGGAMATYAFERLQDPVVVEFIKADVGIDIGDTFIGMHIKHVAVPIRTTEKKLGHANVTLAKTRPKLIGGSRAIYTNEPSNLSC